MSEQQVSGSETAPAPVAECPWCSAPLATGTEERCPSCGAALHESDGSEVPGVTRIDHEALLKGRPTTEKPRGIIGWLSGEYEAEVEAPHPGTLEPPDEAVRREMLRLELVALEAEVHARQAEAMAAAAESGEDISAALEAVEGDDSDADAAPRSAEAAGTETGDEATGDEATGDEATGAEAAGEDATEETREA